MELRLCSTPHHCGSWGSMQRRASTPITSPSSIIESVEWHANSWELVQGLPHLLLAICPQSSIIEVLLVCLPTDWPPYYTSYSWDNEPIKIFEDQCSLLTWLSHRDRRETSLLRVGTTVRESIRIYHTNDVLPALGGGVPKNCSSFSDVIRGPPYPPEELIGNIFSRVINEFPTANGVWVPLILPFKEQYKLCFGIQFWLLSLGRSICRVFFVENWSLEDLGWWSQFHSCRPLIHWVSCWFGACSFLFR